MNDACDDACGAACIGLGLQRPHKLALGHSADPMPTTMPMSGRAANRRRQHAEGHAACMSPAGAAAEARSMRKRVLAKEAGAHG
jgi:hypothetical protein